MTATRKPVRWLHLSDFHVGKDDYGVRSMFDYILRHVKDRKEKGIVPDLLFLTGDLANYGLDSEYLTFWIDFVAPLQELIGGDIAQRTFAVPGNHDVNRKLFGAFSQDDMAKPESRYFDPTDEGVKLRREMLIPRLKAYLDSDLTVGKQGIDSADGAFAQCLTINGHTVGIAGINTAWLSKDDRDQHRLTPGKPLLEKALARIDDAQLRIVLGHHPVDWFRHDQQKAIRSLLGKHRVLYLHGHLHDAWAEPTYGSGNTYLAVQAGAAFQAREGERWRNGLVWGEADPDAKIVRLQPWRWNRDGQSWTPDGDAFHEEQRVGEWWNYWLPGAQSMKADYAAAAPKLQLPKGWAVLAPDDLAAACAPLAEDVALRYFNGAVPDWSTALSSSVPRREIVGSLAAHYADADHANAPIVTLLLAAGCEGKTTALLQAAHAIVKDRRDWRILQRRDESQPLDVAELRRVLDRNVHWLLVLDESDRIAKSVVELLRQLPDELHGRVHALLACRDSDWRASGADDLPWSDACDFHREVLGGLSPRDAAAIVGAWQGFGDAGLGELAGTPQAKRAALLEKRAKDDAKNVSGAFFGALLAVRSGKGLRKHAQVLLERLGGRDIPGGQSLRDALAYIAAMHAEGLEILSRPALAGVLDCPPDKLHRAVLVPLGQEAAATTTSSFIFTRHRHIAETLVSVLEEEFGVDIRALFKRLAKAAIAAANAGEYLPPNLGRWRFGLSQHFFDKGQHDLAFGIGHAILDSESAQAQIRTHLASLYRKAGVPEQGVRLFRAAPPPSQEARSFYYEWGVSEGELGNQINAVMLESFSLSDACDGPQVDNDRARKGLAGMGVAFAQLYADFGNDVFLHARMAIVVIGRTLGFDSTTQAYLREHMREAREQFREKFGQIAGEPALDDALHQLRAGVVAAAQKGLEAQIAAALPHADELTFDGLADLVANSARAR